MWTTILTLLANLLMFTGAIVVVLLFLGIMLLLWLILDDETNKLIDELGDDKEIE